MNDETFNRVMNELYIIKELMVLGFSSEESSEIVREIIEDDNLSECLRTRFRIKSVYESTNQPNCS